jgi:hypothetical protein
MSLYGNMGMLKDVILSVCAREGFQMGARNGGVNSTEKRRLGRALLETY